MDLIQPDTPIPREAVAWFLVREGGYAAAVVTAPSFADASSTDAWAAPAVAADVAAGALHACPDGTFRPDAGLTRAEAVVLLVQLEGRASGE